MDSVKKFTTLFQVTHLLKGDSPDDYVLLHPATAQYIWFPDIYIGDYVQVK